MCSMELHPHRLGAGVENFSDLRWLVASDIAKDHDHPLLLTQLAEHADELNQVHVLGKRREGSGRWSLLRPASKPRAIR